MQNKSIKKKYKCPQCEELVAEANTSLLLGSAKTTNTTTLQSMEEAETLDDE